MTEGADVVVEASQARRSAIGLATVIPMFLVVSCGGVGGVRTAETAGHIALIQSSDVGGGDAAVFGTLDTNEKGCLGLAGPKGEFYVVIWPHSASLDGDGHIRNNRGQVIRIGDHFEAGGGEERFIENYPDQAELCLVDPTDETAVVLVLQSFLD